MKESQEQWNRQTTKIFWLGLETSFIFAIPAIAGVFIGKKIDSWYNTNGLALVATLLVTFVFSWVVVLARYYRLNKKLKEIREKIKTDNHNSDG